MASGGEDMRRAFKTPSLRGVASRSPYMHAGQIEHLGQVIAHYTIAPVAPSGDSELRPLDLSAVQKQHIEAFLASLYPVH